ncbi:hypothetical protein OG741_00860 [Streptomyces sp. NBC_01410]|uniref:hypothetical protein n=1 Tax=Streptomyces sp. NBC_01410 TaxID=2903856 RepID=UPI003252BBF6
MSTAAQDRADDRLRAVIRPLWTEPDPQPRRAIITRLHQQARDVHDVRVAQPALTVAILDPDVDVRRAAMAVTEERAASGADIRLALPAMALVAEHPDTEIRERVWGALIMSDSRHDDAIIALSDLAHRVSVGDPDPDIRHAASRIAARIARVKDQHSSVAANEI